MTARRWEMVAVWCGVGSLDGTVIPASTGRHLRRTWIGARLSAARANRRERRRDTGHLPPARWIVRRVPTLTLTERQEADRIRAVLHQAYMALAYQYGGTTPDQHTEPEDRVGCEAMHAASRALGKS